MNKQIVLKRLKDVLNVDSINSTQADFLSTHVPFRNIKVTNDLSGTPVSEYISEEEVFNRYFGNSEMYNEHQLIVVEGSSGSGKSHFIRWIEAKLAAFDEPKDVVLMIRRSDNTLKGTIKQFLNIEEVKNLKNKDVYERLVKANQNVSEQKFKYEIYHKFLVEIANDDDSILERNDRKCFRELLSSSEFEERMLMPGGPIERIYSKIVDSNTENNEDVLAQFEVEDFVLDYDFNTELKKNASKKAVKMANMLLPEVDGSFPDNDCNPKILAEYMNNKVDTVIKDCAGLEPGDFQQIFREIRQELYKQGKNLILLIEDITACTGINRDLLDALIVKHTGSNDVDHMCRLVSVIGTTEAYFDSLRNNYIDRITTGIKIEDGAIGSNTDDLVQFVAKYLNVMSVSSEEINKWYEDGALDTEYPVHKDTEVNNWESYVYVGKKMSLYPFTKKAIINLYNSMDVEKTPRYIIRKIIEPAVDSIIQNKEMFPKFLLSRKPNLRFEIEDRVKNTVSNMQIGDDEKQLLSDRLLAILGYWGDGTLDTSKKGYLGAINVSVFKEFGLSSFVEKVLGKPIGDELVEDFDESVDTTNNISKEEKSIEKREQVPTVEPPVKKVVNKAYEDFTRILSEWHYDKKSFTKVYQVRDEIGKFVFASIPWQQEGVPLLSVEMVEKSSYDLVEIERQDKKVGKGLIFLEDNDETYRLLLAIGKSLYLGKKRAGNVEFASWDFEDSASSIRIATNWLEKNKQKFVDVVKAFGEKQKCPDYVNSSMVAEIYRGVLNGDYQINKFSDIKPDVFIKDNNLRKQGDLAGHSQGWCDLVSNIIYAGDAAVTNNDTLQRYFNLIQGTQKNAKRKIINYNLLETVYKELKNNKFCVDIENIPDDKIKVRNEAKNYLKKILVRIDKVANEEASEGKKLYETALEYFEFENGSEIETEDIKELLNEIIEFYKETENYGVNVPLRTQEAISFKNKGAEIARAFAVVSVETEDMNSNEIIAMYSKNPMKIIKQFLTFLKNVDEDRSRVYSEMLTTKETLTRSGNWSDDVDPRFDANKSLFDDLIKMMED